MAEEEKKTQDQPSSADSGGGSFSPPHEEEEEEEAKGGAPEWMATFADMVTLLMCFFVLLFAMSSTQQESFKEVIQSLKSALGVQAVPEAGTKEGMTSYKIPEEAKEKPAKKSEAVGQGGAMVQKTIDDIVSNVREMVMFNQLGGKVKVEGDETGATITIADVVIFPPGDVRMNQAGLEVMKKISKVLSQFNYNIRIVGHTDNTPINTERFPSNWELSANRACEVVRFLAAHGIDPRRMSAEGDSEYRPIAANDTAEGRAQNRRVEIVYQREDIAKVMTR